MPTKATAAATAAAKAVNIYTFVKVCIYFYDQTTKFLIYRRR